MHDTICLGNIRGWPVNGIFHFEWFSRFMGGAIGRWANERHALFINKVIPASMKRGKPDEHIMHAYHAPFRASCSKSDSSRCSNFLFALGFFAENRCCFSAPRCSPPKPRRPLHIFPREILSSKLWLSDIEDNLRNFKGDAAFIWPENDIAFRQQELDKW